MGLGLEGVGGGEEVRGSRLGIGNGGRGCRMGVDGVDGGDGRRISRVDGQGVTDIADLTKCNSEYPVEHNK